MTGSVFAMRVNENVNIGKDHLSDSISSFSPALSSRSIPG